MVTPPPTVASSVVDPRATDWHSAQGRTQF